VKARPILFSGAMVAAILAGRKSQTRRVVKPQPPAPNGRGEPYFAQHEIGGNNWLYLAGDAPLPTEIMHCRCPYGMSGDRLWVRETWGYHGGDEYLYQRDSVAVVYRADDRLGPLDPIPGGRWRPSIHMPRWASRITLEITGVRVERLNDISEEDALAEGITWPVPPTLAAQGITEYRPPIDLSGLSTLRHAANRFRELWESISSPGSWDANPWVWVIEFRRVEAKP
jgi:hypothetical protein